MTIGMRIRNQSAIPIKSKGWPRKYWQNMNQILKEKPQRKETELLVFVKAKKLTEYVMQISAKAPVKFRYSVLNPLIKECIDMIHLLYEANELKVDDPERAKLIRKAMARLKCIDYISSLATTSLCFTSHQSEVVTRYCGDCSKYLLGYYGLSKGALAI